MVGQQGRCGFAMAFETAQPTYANEPGSAVFVRAGGPGDLLPEY